MKDTLMRLAVLPTLIMAAVAPAAALDVTTIPADTTALHGPLTADEIKTGLLKSSQKIIMPDGGSPMTQSRQDSVRRIIETFYYDQFRHFSDPLAPYFLMMSKDARLAMGVGGTVRMRAWYDFAGSIPANGFTPYLIPVPSDPAQRRKLGATPGGCALFMRVIGRNRTLGDIVAYVQADYSGGTDNHFKLKKAYVSISDWTVGYTSSVFNDPAAEAPTIDGAGQAGKGGRSSVLVRWDHRFRSAWSMGAGLMIPSSQADTDDAATKTIPDWFPDIAAYGQFNMAHNAHVRLAAMMRVLPYRDLVAMKNRNRIGWGVQVSAVLYPLTRLAIYAEANTGCGYSSYLGDLRTGRHDLLADPSHPGQMYAPRAVGLNFGCKYNFRHNLYACMALAEARYFDRRAASPDTYKYGLYGSWSLFWEPTPRLQAGAEYLTGRRGNTDGSHGSANRVNIMFQFSF